MDKDAIEQNFISHSHSHSHQCDYCCLRYESPRSIYITFLEDYGKFYFLICNFSFNSSKKIPFMAKLPLSPAFGYHIKKPSSNKLLLLLFNKDYWFCLLENHPNFVRGGE